LERLGILSVPVTVSLSLASGQPDDYRYGMQRRSWLVIASLVMCGVARIVSSPADPPPNTLTAEEKAAGWKLLFDGTTMKGWRGYLKPDASGLRWKVHDGCIGLARGQGQDTLGERDLITTDTYGDFDVRFTWKVEPGSNSGVKYFVTEDAAVRGPGGAKVGGALGHEYQVIDDERHEDAKIGTTHKTAAFYDVKAAASHPMLPAGTWNQSRILVQGNHVEHWLNGTKVLEYELGSPEILQAVKASKFKDVGAFGTKVRGHILLQDHGDAVCYKDIKIKS
jgi:hypothetical protein